MQAGQRTTLLTTEPDKTLVLRLKESLDSSGTTFYKLA